ncbi:MAG TPA: hypothetical protein PKA41_05240 [Verrucomicrobiota bacterium]|nr:hypothetical protein [Verrucomicrobiota bacterium]
MNRPRPQPSPAAAGHRRLQMWIILGAPVVVMAGLIVAGLLWKFRAPGSRLQYGVISANTNAAARTNPPATAE